MYEPPANMIIYYQLYRLVLNLHIVNLPGSCVHFKHLPVKVLSQNHGLLTCQQMLRNGFVINANHGVHIKYDLYVFNWGSWHGCLSAVFYCIECNKVLGVT